MLRLVVLHACVTNRQAIPDHPQIITHSVSARSHSSIISDSVSKRVSLPSAAQFFSPPRGAQGSSSASSALAALAVW